MFCNHTCSENIRNCPIYKHAVSLIASISDKQYLTLTHQLPHSVPYTHVDVSNSGCAGKNDPNLHCAVAITFWPYAVDMIRLSVSSYT